MAISHDDLIDLFGVDGVRVFSESELPAPVIGRTREYLTTVGFPRRVDDVFTLGAPRMVPEISEKLCFLGTGWYDESSVYIDTEDGHVVERSPYDVPELWHFVNSSVELLGEYLYRSEILVQAADMSPGGLKELAQDTQATLTAADPKAAEDGTFWGLALYEMVRML